MSGLGPQTVKLLTSISVAAVAGLSVYFFLVKGSSSVGKLEISTDTTSSKKKLAYEEEIDNCVYCDYNATTPIYKEVFESMTPYFTKGFGNPSSSHVYGLCAKEAVARARHEVSEAINCKPSEVYFVSCGTEADNRAVDIAIHAFKSQKNNSDSTIPVVITSSIEHVAVLCPLRHLHSLHKKIILKVIPVDSEGFVSLTDLEKELTPNVALVSIMHSNNEVGTIQPIRAISRIIKKFNKAENTNILFHTDAAQSFGKVPIDVEGLGVDMATLVGHKFGAPKGVGALFLREGIKASPMLVGGSQENGLRGGKPESRIVCFR
jgi:cysteine desulfurase